MKYPTLDKADLQGKKVLVRAGFDVPMEGGQVQDRTRIEALVPTMRYILDHGGALILMAHQGRPEGIDLTFSQKPLVPVLEELLSTKVYFAESATGDVAKTAAAKLNPGEVLLLENLRFDERESSKDSGAREALAKELASLADLYVNDAFTNSHRNHASMTGVPKFLPGYLGLQIAREVEGLSKVTDSPKKPICLLISGAKIETKVPVIQQFLKYGGDILVGGCIANTLIAAKGFTVAKSRYDKEFVDLAKELMAESQKPGQSKIHIPTDVVVATEPTDGAAKQTVAVDAIPADMAIFDMGPKTIEQYCSVIAKAGTVVWNGPLGLYEVEQFADGSKKIAKAVLDATKKGAVSIIGGGDTLDFHDRYTVSMEDYTFASTAGGAMLDFISGKDMPALKALER